MTARRRSASPPAPRGPTDIDRALARRLRGQRIALGITQQQMAERLGVSYQQVHKYEIGANRIGVARLITICAVLAIEPAELLRDLAPVAKRPEHVQRDQLMLAQDVARLDSHTRKALARFIGILARRPS